MIDVVVRDASDVDANTVFLNATADIVDEPVFFTETDHLARELIVEWNGYGVPGVMATRYSVKSLPVSAKYGVHAQRTVSACHASLAGVEWLVERERQAEPYIGCSFRVKRRAWFTQPGSTMVIKGLRDALDVKDQT